MDRFYVIHDEKRRPYKEEGNVVYFRKKHSAKQKRDNLINSNKKRYTVSTGPDYPKKET